MNAARHEWINAWCTRLEAMLHAAPCTAPPAQGGRLVALPAWLWLAPAIDVGRKAVRADGRTMLMPMRIRWEASDDHLLSLPVGRHDLT